MKLNLYSVVNAQWKVLWCFPLSDPLSSTSKIDLKKGACHLVAVKRWREKKNNFLNDVFFVYHKNWYLNNIIDFFSYWKTATPYCEISFEIYKQLNRHIKKKTPSAAYQIDTSPSISDYRTILCVCKPMTINGIKFQNHEANPMS